MSCMEPRKFKWTDQAQKTFENLKEKMINHIPLSAADTKLPFYIASDSSKIASGFIVYQIVKTNHLNQKDHSDQNDLFTPTNLLIGKQVLKYKVQNQKILQ